MKNLLVVVLSGMLITTYGHAAADDAAQPSKIISLGGKEIYAVHNPSGNVTAQIELLPDEKNQALKYRKLVGECAFDQTDDSRMQLQLSNNKLRITGRVLIDVDGQPARRNGCNRLKDVSAYVSGGMPMLQKSASQSESSDRAHYPAARFLVLKAALDNVFGLKIMIQGNRGLRMQKYNRSEVFGEWIEAGIFPERMQGAPTLSAALDLYKADSPSDGALIIDLKRALDVTNKYWKAEFPIKAVPTIDGDLGIMDDGLRFVTRLQLVEYEKKKAKQEARQSERSRCSCIIS